MHRPCRRLAPDTKLRELAKEAAKEPEGGWLDEMLRDHGSCVYQEEHMLFGMASGYRKASREEHAAMLDIWVPGVLSWADCDCSTSTYKWMEKDPDSGFLSGKMAEQQPGI